MGIAEAITLILIILRLIGVIHWDWFLVVAPELIAFFIYALMIALIIFIEMYEDH